MKMADAVILPASHRDMVWVCYLDDGGVSEGVKQDVHVMSHCQCVDEVVLATCRYLHETREAHEAPVRVMLQWVKGL